MKTNPTSQSAFFNLRVLIAAVFSVAVTHAASPPGGTVDPSTTTPVEWDDTAIGTGGTDETTAI